MSSTTVRSLVKSRLENDWPQRGDAEIVDVTNLHIDRGVDDSLWVALEFPGGSEEIISMGDPGNNLYREFGVINVHVLVPSGSGATEALTAIESIRVLFRGAEFGTDPNFVRCYGADPATTSDRISPATIEGQWYIMSCSIDYTFDAFGGTA